MSKARSKRYTKCSETVPDKKLSVEEGVKALKDFANTKFDSTVELVMHLGIDPKQADQMLRGSISLPNGIGKTKKVIAFCEGQDAENALEAGAVESGGEELVKKILDGWTDFDVAVAVPPMMRVVSKLGRVLGPVGKMPSPKAGTVSADIVEVVKDFSAGKVEYRNDDGGNLHVPVGKISFDAQQLAENIEHFVVFIKKVRPAAAKGTYIKKISISGTMTPSVELDVA